MNEEEINVLYNEILKLPKVDKPITASAMCELSVNELMDTLRVFRHIPEYSELMHSNCEKDKEIERLNKELEFEKSKNKEVREYIENYNIGMPYDHFVKKENLLEILDKENI